jgi:hypothetical protein
MPELRFGTFRAEILRREKMRDANARVRVLVNPMLLQSVLRSSVRGRGPCNGRRAPLRAAASEPTARHLQREFSNLADGSGSTQHRDRAISVNGWAIRSANAKASPTLAISRDIGAAIRL